MATTCKFSPGNRCCDSWFHTRLPLCNQNTRPDKIMTTSAIQGQSASKSALGGHGEHLPPANVDFMNLAWHLSQRTPVDPEAQATPPVVLLTLHAPGTGHL